MKKVQRHAALRPTLLLLAACAHPSSSFCRVSAGLKPFVYVSLKDWCRPVATPDELESRPNSFLPTRYRAGFETFGRPDYHSASDEPNIAAYGTGEFISVKPYHVPVLNYSVWNEDVFMANVANALVLRDNLIEGRCHVFLRDGIAAAETYHSMLMAGPISEMAREEIILRLEDHDIPVRLYRDLPAVDHLPEEGILMTHLMMDNYAHFLNEVIPRFWWLEAIPSLRRYPILMPQYAEGTYQCEVLKPLLQGLRVCPLSAPAARFKRLFVPTFLANGSYSSEMVAFTDRTVRRALGVATEKRRRRRIYVSRNDATQRRVLNEDQLIKALQPLGFEAHTTGRMSARSQVELFSEADIIIGPHGAGLANIVFAPAASLLIEIVADPYLHPIFWIISKLNRMRYARLIEPAVTDTFDINVDVTRLIRVVESFLNRKSDSSVRSS
jgi:capsular polysaccharide biosynthesis protein